MKVSDAQVISPFDRSLLIDDGRYGQVTSDGCRARSRAKKVPVKNRSAAPLLSTPVVGSARLRRAVALVAVSVLTVTVGLLGGSLPAAAAPPASITGQACAPGTGVTVAVDFAPVNDEVKIGCAVGAQTSMATAGAAAGFTLSPTTGFLASIDTVAPTDPLIGYWSIYINTTDGQPAGTLGSTLTFAQTGIDGGPLALDTVLLFDLVEDFNAPQEDPRITLAEIAATAPADPAPVQPATVSGAACAPGTGVTVAVDFAPASNDLKIGCALGGQATMATAGAAAGFTFSPTTGFLASIDTVAPTDPLIGYWSIYINTTDGQPAGPLGPNWSFAQTGIDGGPVAVDGVLLFDLVEDFNAPQEDPRITLAEIAATAPAPITPPGNEVVDPPSYPASGDGDALAAAGWIGRQLDANGGVLPGSGGTDYGLTIDAIFALSAAGVGGNEIDAAAAALYHSGHAYIGASGTSAANAGKIAKTTLALQIAGLDPTSFMDGVDRITHNLPAELRSAMTPDGQFGPNDFPLVHALAILALDRTAGGVPAEAVTWLQAAQCRDTGSALGAYGFSGCADVDVDGTSLATQALLAAGVPAADPSIADAAAWLSANQQTSGALLSSFGGANTNGTGLGGQTFLALGNGAAATSAAGFIGGLQVSCDSLVDGSLLTVADVGGIAYDAAGLQDGNEFGIDSISVDQWRRASTQAILGLGLPAFDSITAAGADPELPAAPTCQPVASIAPVVPLSTLPTATTTTPVGPQLSNTGVTTATLPMTVTGLAAILIGFGLLLMARRTRSGQHS